MRASEWPLRSQKLNEIMGKIDEMFGDDVESDFLWSDLGLCIFEDEQGRGDYDRPSEIMAGTLALVGEAVRKNKDVWAAACPHWDKDCVLMVGDEAELVAKLELILIKGA